MMDRALYAASLLAIVAVTLLAGCAPDAPPPKLVDLTPPSAADLDQAAPLPDIPACPSRNERERIACRAAYDETTRGQYVQLAGRHKAVAGWVRVVTAPRP